MSNLKPSNNCDQGSLDFLAQNPKLYHSLIADFGPDLSHVSTLVTPLLNVSKRCEISVYYIQAVATGRSAFLTTNLPNARATQVTETKTNWLIGRSRTCAISIPSPSISRAHAVIGHRPNGEFYIMDVGSRNGTFVNQNRLAPNEQLILHDGAVIEFSHIRVELFISGWQEGAIARQNPEG